ncbi:MAG: jacalin-like lectin [Phycisphaeraceae bacterium]
MTGTPGGGAFRVWEIGRVLPGDARLTRLAFIHSGRIDGVIATVSINGQEWESPRFGVGEVGRKLETTTIDIGPDDHLISIDVFMGRSSNGGPIITKLIVRMSKQVVEVGEKTGEFKGTALCPPGRRVVGVCGRAGWFLDSIGLQTVNK